MPTNVFQSPHASVTMIGTVTAPAAVRLTEKLFCCVPVGNDTTKLLPGVVVESIWIVAFFASWKLSVLIEPLPAVIDTNKLAPFLDVVTLTGGLDVAHDPT